METEGNKENDESEKEGQQEPVEQLVKVEEKRELDENNLLSGFMSSFLVPAN